MSAQARPIDGSEGYKFWLAHDGEPGVEEVNEYLRGIGLREVRPRMIIHYKKLQKHGYRGYVTQNRLDLSVAGDPGWFEEMGARYSEVTEPAPVSLRWGDESSTGESLGIGLSSATVQLQSAPSAGTHAVLRFTSSGIERLGVVRRSDPHSGIVNLGFDVYGGLPIAPPDAPNVATIRLKVPEEAETIPGITDLFFRIERAVARSQGEVTHLPRVESLSMTSPLQIVVLSIAPLSTVIGLITAVVIVRNKWFEGTKTKREAEGLALDNDLKRRTLQAEVDKDFRTAVEATLEDRSDGAALMNELTEAGASEAAASLSRREFFSAAAAAAVLPTGIEISEGRIEASHEADGGGSDD